MSLEALHMNTGAYIMQSQLMSLSPRVLLNVNPQVYIYRAEMMHEDDT